MIVVAEGPSAAGKSTWANTFPMQHVIPETGTIEVPISMSDAEHAAFWNSVNCARWTDAVGVEESTGLAVCDTDPLKLHYDYCLARIGAANWERFDCGVADAKAAITEQRLGIADLVVVHLPDDQTLVRQRDSDRSRRRRNFELHRRLAEPLRDWYEALDRLDPGRVRWDFLNGHPPHVHRNRFDQELFAAWMTDLPRRTARP